MFSYSISDRHYLQLLEHRDTEALFALTDANRDYLRTWLPWLDVATSPNNTKTFIQFTLQQFADQRGLVAAIWYDQAIAGVIGYNHLEWSNRIGQIGYWLAQRYQGQGLMTRSCQAIIDYGFTFLRLNRLVIACASDNSRSRAIPERLGFTHEGTAREAEWLYDRFVDHEIYALLYRDWQAQTDSASARN